MKKVLLATSILAASAGFAAAEVAVSGSARMGLVYDGDDAAFSSRVRIVFTASGETDGGLSFGASMRADQDGGNGNDAGDTDSNTKMKDATVYISGAFGKLTFGDNDSAANVLVGQVSGVGYTGIGDANEVFYGSHTDTSALYEYSTGALSFALSTGQVNSDEYAVAVKYSTDAFSVALGWEGGDGAGADRLYLGGSGTFGAATVKAVVADYDDGSDTDFALSVDYVTGAATVTAFYHDAPEAFGIGASYDLGGGAAVKGGVVNLGIADETVADIGITMSF